MLNFESYWATAYKGYKLCVGSTGRPMSVAAVSLWHIVIQSKYFLTNLIQGAGRRSGRGTALEGYIRTHCQLTTSHFIWGSDFHPFSGERKNSELTRMTSVPFLFKNYDRRGRVEPEFMPLNVGGSFLISMEGLSELTRRFMEILQLQYMP